MPDEKNEQQEQNGIFEDLLRDAPISSLNIEEPEFDSFDIDTIVAQAKAQSEQDLKNSRKFGKRTRRVRIENDQEESKEESKPSALETLRQSEPAVKKEQPTYSQIVRSEKERSQAGKPRTFREVLNASLISDPDQDEPLDASLIINTPTIEEEVIMDENAPVITKPQPSLDTQSAPAAKEESEPEEKKDEPKKEEKDDVIDPSASLVDDYHYDEYEDKKHFLLSDYKKMEEYLARQSEQGFHFVRHEGKKYYFIKAKPHHYYYKVLYFAKEPSKEQFEKWADEGWKQVDQSPSRHKRDAGWYVLRNEKAEGELPRDIENEEEKYRYFSKFSSSCRSTMFLLFVVMVCSALSVWLQIQFKGFMAVMIASAVLFFVTLWIFLVYARMLAKSRKQASLLSARIRLADHDPEYQALLHGAETDAQLDEDWNKVGKHDEDSDASEE